MNDNKDLEASDTETKSATCDVSQDSLNADVKSDGSEGVTQDVYLDASEEAVVMGQKELGLATIGGNHNHAPSAGISSLNQACGAVSYAVLLKKNANTLSLSQECVATETYLSHKSLDHPDFYHLEGSSNALLSSSLNGSDTQDLSHKSSFVSTEILFGDDKSNCGDINGELNKSVASTGSDGRKKRKGNWYSVLSPNYKSKCDDFKRIFKDIPNDERLMVDYSCALQKDILVHGRLYITQNWVCFYANIFRWETQISIRCRHITAMTKEKTARVIPNAIQICTNTDKLFFTSFGARDKTYLMLFRVWQNALMEQPMSPQEMWQWVHYSYGEELGLTSSDDDYIAPSCSEGDKASDTPHSPPDSGLDHIDVRPRGGSKSPIDDDASGPDNRGDTGASDARQLQQAFDSSTKGLDELPTDFSDNTDCSDDEVVCTGHEHAGLTTIDEIFEMTVDDMFTNLFTDSEFFVNLQTTRKTYDMDLSNWEPQPDTDGHLRRVISYTLTLTNPLGPKNSYVKEVQTRYKHSKPGTVYVIDCEVNNSGVPYGDNFYVVNRYCITRAGQQKCRLRVCCQIKFRKTVWGVVRNFINKNVTQGLNDHFDMLASALRKQCSDKIGAGPILEQQQMKKRVRRRRRLLGELNPSPSRLPDVAAVNHSSNRIAVTATRRSDGEVTVTSANVESQLKIFSIVLLVLIVLNIILYYNVCVLEISLRQQQVYPHSIPQNVPYPESASEWALLLAQQQRLHEAEMERWKAVVGSTILLVDQVKQTLITVQSSFDRQPSSKSSQWTKDDQR